MSVSLSVIIPVYNCARYIGHALESIAAQTVPATEVLVVDDASSDGTIQTAVESGQKLGLPMRILRRSSNGGIAATRNTGLREAVGEWMAFLDGDDLWHPEKTAIQMAVAGRGGGHRIITCEAEEFLDEGSALAGSPSLKLGGILCGGMICAREVFDVLGHFEETLRTGEFVEWMARVRRDGIAVGHVSERLLKRRIHRNNTVRAAEARSEYLRAIRLVMASRRADPS